MTTQKSNPDNELTTLSNAMADAVERAGQVTVLVNARRRFPASGIIYTADMVLTADHVVEREDDINILLPNGQETPARLAGRDPGSDLALLRLDTPTQPPTQPVQSEARVGQLVLALGRPSPAGLQASLGIISAKGGPLRTGRGGLLEQYLTTDAIPYPGFSGGPLIDASGQVLGINTSGLTRGASLAIPASLAWRIAETLAQHGRVRHGYLGIRSQPVALPAQGVKALNRNQEVGLLLVGVEEGSPAAAGGLMVGDILVSLNNQPLSDPDDLLSRLVGSLVGKPTPVEVLRGGQLHQLTVTVGERK